MKYLYTLLLTFFYSLAHAATLPQAEPVPGGIAIVRLTGNYIQAPGVFFNGQRVMVVKDARQWAAIVGIPLKSAPGTATLQIQTSDAQKISQDFAIHDKEYATQQITIKDKRKVDPSAQDLKRIHRESREMQADFRRPPDYFKVTVLYRR